MDQLQHDPRAKTQIKEALFQFLYDPVRKQFGARLETIILRNTLAGGYTHQSFSYKGKFYNIDPSPPPLKRNRLIIDLRPEMDKYLKDLKALNDEEIPFVLGFITQVLNSSNNLPDYFRVFPESVHRPLTALVNTCPCRTTSLSDEKVKQLIERNQESIQWMKRRMVQNLLI